MGINYERMKDDIKNGKIDVLLTTDLGRVCRCGLELEALINLMKLREYRFVAIDDRIDIDGLAGLELFKKLHS